MLIKRRLLSLIYPRDLCCALCGGELEKQETACCQGCAEAFRWGVQRREIAGLDSVYIASEYGDGLRKAILAFKYRNHRYMARFFALQMEGFPREEGAVLIPVPIHKLRRKERGFCQTTELCEELSLLTRLPVEKNALRRTRNTPSQTGLDARERKENLKDAFFADGRKVGGKRCILVDDVVSTGSTLGECAGQLRAAGAASVSAWSIAT